MMVTDCQLENAFAEYRESLLMTCANPYEVEEEHFIFVSRMEKLLNHSEHQDSILAVIDQFFSGVKRWVA